MRPYTKDYKNSENFAAFSKGNTPNLKLTGDLWSSMIVKEVRPTFITIGFDNPTDEAKAAGNFLGTYGKSFPKPSLARRFLGIPNEQLQEIKNQFRTLSPPPEESRTADAFIEAATSGFLSSVTRRLFNQ